MHQTWVGECGRDEERKGRIAHETVQQTCQLELHVFSGDFVNANRRPKLMIFIYILVFII